MESQLTLRVPADLARRLAARAKATGAKRSQVVREALQAFLAVPREAPRSTSVRERLGVYIGAVSLDRPSTERDDLAQRLRSHNWRERRGPVRAMCCSTRGPSLPRWMRPISTT